jgi:adenine specific DNA methylase Mod
VFGRCKDLTELWVSLIEKAYAKLHLNYEALVSGFIDDALTDLTGFVAENFNLHDKRGVFPNKKLGTKDEFWDYLKMR